MKGTGVMGCQGGYQGYQGWLGGGRKAGVSGQHIGVRGALHPESRAGCQDRDLQGQQPGTGQGELVTSEMRKTGLT